MFFLLVLLDGDIKKYLQGIWTECVPLKYLILCLISKKPNVLNLQFKFCPPPLGTARGEKIICP